MHMGNVSDNAIIRMGNVGDNVIIIIDNVYGLGLVLNSVSPSGVHSTSPFPRDG